MPFGILPRRLGEYAAVRGRHNTEARKLIAANLKADLRAIKAKEDSEIRNLLSPEQSERFEAYVRNQ